MSNQNKQKNEKEQSVSAFRNAKEAAAKEAREKELAERKRQAEAEETAYQEREEYAKNLSENKVALMRMKQGVDDEETSSLTAEEPKKKYTIWQKISNWFYHSKWWLGIAAFCTLLAAFLIYDKVTTKTPDMRVLVLTGDSYFTSKEPEFCDTLENFCEDTNGDGEVLVSTISIPMNKQLLEGASSAAQSYNTQLTVVFQSAMCMFLVVDADADECLDEELPFVDLEEKFPQYDFIEGKRAYVDNTKLAEVLGMEQPMRKGTYLALREPAENMDSLEENQEAYDIAYQALDQLLKLITAEEGAS